MSKLIVNWQGEEAGLYAGFFMFDLPWSDFIGR